MVAVVIRKVFRARAGEERAVGLAFAYFFMLLCAYYLLRPLRDALAIDTGLENLPWLYTGTFTAMLVLTPLFGALVSRVRKQLLLPVVYGFFASNLLVFYLLFKSIPDASWLGAAFFIWLSAFNYFVVSVFWSFMADVFRDEEAKRLFGPIAAGGGAGAILGPLLMQFLVPRIGVDAVVGLAMLLLLGTLPCIRALARWAEARHGRFVLPEDDPASRIGGGVLSGLVLVARSPYLLGIFTVMAIGSIAGVFMYYELLRLVEMNYADLPSRAQFLGRLDAIVNFVAWVFQGFVVGWLIRRFELAGALVTIPIAALVSFVVLAAAPVLMVLAAGQVVRRAGEYGIAKPSREVLYTVVDTETKYKAKNFIDTVMQRGSDLVGIWLHLLVQAAGIALVGYSLICAGGMIAAIAVSLGLGRAFARRQAAATS
jgi:ATP:ADP antiporter, AAA family